MLKKVFYALLILILILGIVYFLGPKAKFAEVDYSSSYSAPALNIIDSVIAAEEAVIPDIKPDNQARIIWADSTQKVKTKYSVVYMHGFSASQEEGDPLHTSFAKRYGMNLYLPRLIDHGRSDSNTFISLTPDAFFESAQQALKVGEALGDSVIVISCSTGGTLAIMLEQIPNKIAGHVFYSPNIDIYDPKSDLITEPWGKQILKLVMGGEYNRINYKPEAKPYWSNVYHMNGVVALKWMLKKYMTPESFAKFNKPFFLGYYKKNEQEQDKVVSVDAMLEFFGKSATPTDKKRKENFTEAGAHVISSYVFSKEIDRLAKETYRFAEEVLGFKPIQ